MLARVAPFHTNVLVVGPTRTADDRAFLQGYAVDVAEETGTVATYALHNDYSVTDFDALYVVGTATTLRDASGLVLVAEALAAGMEVYDSAHPQEAGYCVCGLGQNVQPLRDERGDIQCFECSGLTMGCAHCGESADVEELEIVKKGSTFSPVHSTCITEARREHPRAKIVTA
ncbi:MULTISPECIES: hypothetical protein [unclassified Streptomyces]|uniref:hypothetical protein n=1 Tax=unclassified Streptomyces TaxID=2593676 RepID=UPI000B5028F3|nr:MULTISPECIES: hypothetical protein [unclassified Streptomyces]MYX02248.1 hypothetical protein [Streptomyces sp. SID8378]SNB63933.1 hypothetical protein SAMN02745831_00379 [Streptomyces sp. PgraA7]